MLKNSSKRRVSVVVSKSQQRHNKGKTGQSIESIIKCLGRAPDNFGKEYIWISSWPWGPCIFIMGKMVEGWNWRRHGRGRFWHFKNVLFLYKMVTKLKFLKMNISLEISGKGDMELSPWHARVPSPSPLPWPCPIIFPITPCRYAPVYVLNAVAWTPFHMYENERFKKSPVSSLPLVLVMTSVFDHRHSHSTCSHLCPSE